MAPLHLASAGRSTTVGLAQWHRRHSARRARLITVRRFNDWWACVDTWEWWFGTDELRLLSRTEIYLPAGSRYELAVDFTQLTSALDDDDHPLHPMFGCVPPLAPNQRRP